MEDLKVIIREVKDNTLMYMWNNNMVDLNLARLLNISCEVLDDIL